MSSRLDQEREARLQPIRMRDCKEKLEEMGFRVNEVNHTELAFKFKGSLIAFFPYSGWHSGRTIEDGRGFQKLIKQLI